MSSYIVLKNIEKAFKELDKIDEWRLKKMNKNTSVKTIEQQDFLQEYLKDKPDFRYESSFYIFTAENNNYVILVYDYEDNFYCKITFHNKNPVAQFLLPQTYEQFKTIMDIFLGVENGKQE